MSAFPWRLPSRASAEHVVGFDVSAKRVAELSAGTDRTGEAGAEALADTGARFSSDPSGAFGLRISSW